MNRRELIVGGLVASTALVIPELCLGDDMDRFYRLAHRGGVVRFQEFHFYDGKGIEWRDGMKTMFLNCSFQWHKQVDGYLLHDKTSFKCGGGFSWCHFIADANKGIA